MRVRALSIHADYRCKSAAACCRSGWEIAVEPAAEARIRRGVAEGRLAPADWARAAAGQADGARVRLRVLPSGDCAFLAAGEPRLCSVHGALGEEALPSACRQFPRVVTLTPLGASVTLSHYCPTAAALLFRDDVALAIVSDPPGFPPGWSYEGLDAKDALPPLLRPGVLASWAAHERLERHAVARFADPELAPARVLASLAAEAEALRAWSVAVGPFDDWAAAVIERPPLAHEPVPLPRLAAAPSWSSLAAAHALVALAPELEAWERAARAVPPAIPKPRSPRVTVEVLGRERVRDAVGESFTEHRVAVSRWLAAKAFASWLSLQGDGVRTSVLGLELAHAVLRAEAARGVAETGGALDREGLVQAVRRADLLLVHLADPQALARDLSRCEAPAGRVVASGLPPKR